MPIYRLIDKIQDEPYFSFPNAKMGTENGRTKNERVRCSYHKEQGHFTTGCKPFKAFLEQLVAAGHLRAYIDQNKTDARAARTVAQAEDDIPIINVIHGLADPEETARLHAEIKDAKLVMNIGSDAKRFRKDSSAKCAITFTERDLDNVQLPHSDALVVTLRIGPAFVKRVLVDQGSSAEVMYYSLFKTLKLNREELRPAKVPLIGFTGAPVWPLGLISLPVRAGSVTL